MIGCGMDVQHVGCSKQSRRYNVRFLTIYHSLMRNSSVDSFRGINMRSEKFIKTLYEPTWATFISSYFHILHFMSKELVISYIIRQNGVMNWTIEEKLRWNRKLCPWLTEAHTAAAVLIDLFVPHVTCSAWGIDESWNLIWYSDNLAWLAWWADRNLSHNKIH